MESKPPLIICVDEDGIEVIWDYEADPQKLGVSLQSIQNGKFLRAIRESMITEMRTDPVTKMEFFRKVMLGMKDQGSDMPLVRASQVL